MKVKDLYKLFIPKFDYNLDELPQEVLIVLREQIRSLFRLRSEYKNNILSNAALNKTLSQWWDNHKSIIRASSSSPDWDYKNLSLSFKAPLCVSPNFEQALECIYRLFSLKSYGASNYIGTCEHPYNSFYSDSGYRELYNKLPYLTPLYKVFVSIIRKILLENDIVCPGESKDNTLFVSSTSAESLKEFINSNQKFEEGKPWFFKTFGCNLNAFAERLYNAESVLYKATLDSFVEFLTNDSDAFIAEVLKVIRAAQIDSKGIGTNKNTLFTKVCGLYFDLLVALHRGKLSSLCDSLKVYSGNFKDLVKMFKNTFTYYVGITFKVRSSDYGGYSLVSYGSFEQVFALIQDLIKGQSMEESFVISYHPCDMITCSCGSTWSSCFSFIDILEEFPDKFYSVLNNYRGLYHKGTFHFMVANACMAYTPASTHSNLPQYLYPKKRRCWMWISNDLKSIRQNKLYPSGDDRTSEGQAYGKILRTYLEGLICNYDTSLKNHWRVSSLNGATYIPSSCAIKEERNSYFYGYDDPILKVAYNVSTDTLGPLYYSKPLPRFDLVPNDYDNSNYSLFNYSSGTKICRICGSRTRNSLDICPTCQGEMINISNEEGFSFMKHPSDVIKVYDNNIVKYLTAETLHELENYIYLKDTGKYINKDNSYEVITSEGIVYYSSLPDDVKKCSHCGKYFASSLMVGDVCINHLEYGSVDTDSLVSKFIHGDFVVIYDDVDKLSLFLSLLDSRDIMWKAGYKASTFIPNTSCLGRHICCKDSVLFLKKNVTTRSISIKTLMEGGEQ